MLTSRVTSRVTSMMTSMVTSVILLTSVTLMTSVTSTWINTKQNVGKVDFLDFYRFFLTGMSVFLTVGKVFFHYLFISKMHWKNPFLEIWQNYSLSKYLQNSALGETFKMQNKNYDINRRAELKLHIRA